MMRKMLLNTDNGAMITKNALYWLLNSFKSPSFTLLT